MINTVGGIIFIIFGGMLAIFYKQIASKTATFYYRLLHVHFSETGYQIAFMVAGIAFIIFGILSIFGIIKSK